MRVGAVDVDLSTPVVMTILNVTPDSFFAGSRRWSQQEIEMAVHRAIDAGTTIIDIGGYSSRPGADDVSPQQEFERVARGVEVVRRISESIVVSIDTFRAEVAQRVLEQYGACIINDISAGELDPAIVDVVAKGGVPYIAMHMRGTPSTMQQYADYDDVTADVVDYFRIKVQALRARGVDDIILDPGFGFAKTLQNNYQLLKELNRFSEFGLPVLAGISRKSMIYKVLDVEPRDALNGTTALGWEALRGGAKILRVHDTAEAVEVIRLFNYYMKA